MSVRTEMASGFAAVRTEMADGFASSRQDNADTRSQMRALHEEVIGRIALLQEPQNAVQAKARRTRKTP